MRKGYLPSKIFPSDWPLDKSMHNLNYTKITVEVSVL